MKTITVFLAILGLGLAVPTPRKLFHEHFEDFLTVIMEEAGHDIAHLMEHYFEFEEFTSTFEYLKTKDFNDLLQDIEHIPEFQAVVEFLENDDIDISFFIDILESMIDQVDAKKRQQSKHEISGRDFSAFMKDTISEFPKAKLAALFEEKLAEDEKFKNAIENLKSDEWAKVYSALWENATFLEEMQILKDNGIDVEIVLLEVMAVFGQN